MGSRSRHRGLFLSPVLAVLATATPAPGASPVLHVPIPDNIEDDYSLGATVVGDLPAALETKSGLVRSPDARKPPSSEDASYGQTRKIGDLEDDGTYSPDRNTERPDVLGYDEPFRPATAPFKRLSAFDAVDASYRLRVRRPHQDPLARVGTGAVEAQEESFFADVVVELRGSKRVRIPSVGPGARVVRSHLAAGDRDIAFSLFKDTAENWFVSSIDDHEHVRGRLVMEVAIAREAFGGEFENPAWSALNRVPELPPNVQAAARRVANHIGVSRSMSYREVLKKLVAYHRSFVDSKETPSGHGDIYLDLALSQKGVCRHRSFSFLVTALGLGIPTRMVINEAHAWVEVDDGKRWRRVDLGGAGRTANEPLRTGIAYEPPADPFQWPAGAGPGETLLGNAPSSPPDPNSSGHRSTGSDPNDRSDRKGARTDAKTADGAAGDPRATSSTDRAGSFDEGMPDTSSSSREKDDRPRSIVTLLASDVDPRRGSPLRVSGTVTAEREACSNVVVDVALREVGMAHPTELRVGSVATDARGHYQGSLVVPTNIPVGDYELVAKTSGNVRCGKGP